MGSGGMTDEPLAELLSRVRADILKLNEYVEYLESGYDTIFTDLDERATFLNVISCDFEELANRYEKGMK